MCRDHTVNLNLFKHRNDLYLPLWQLRLEGVWGAPELSTGRSTCIWHSVYNTVSVHFRIGHPCLAAPLVWLLAGLFLFNLSFNGELQHLIHIWHISSRNRCMSETHCGCQRSGRCTERLGCRTAAVSKLPRQAREPDRPFECQRKCVRINFFHFSCLLSSFAIFRNETQAT